MGRNPTNYYKYNKNKLVNEVVVKEICEDL